MLVINKGGEIPDNAKSVEEQDDGSFHVFFATDQIVMDQEIERKKGRDFEARAKFKDNRKNNVNNITVTTTANNIFDGDEKSQDRMVRAIIVMNDTDRVSWVLNNNKVIQASKSELIEALKLAGQRQSELWIK